MHDVYVCLPSNRRISVYRIGVGDHDIEVRCVNMLAAIVNLRIVKKYIIITMYVCTCVQYKAHKPSHVCTYVLCTKRYDVTCLSHV